MCKDCNQICATSELVNDRCEDCVSFDVQIKKECSTCGEYGKIQHFVDGTCVNCGRESCQSCSQFAQVDEHGFCEECSHLEEVHNLVSPYKRCRGCDGVFNRDKLRNGYCMECDMAEEEECVICGKYDMLNDFNECKTCEIER